MDFLGYMMFSGFEYLAIFGLIFALFNLKIKYFIGEIFISILVVTLATYFLVIFNIHDIVPLPLLIIPALAIAWKKVLNKSYAYSLLIIFGGFVLYLLIQFGVVSIASSMDAIKVTDLNNPFNSKTFILQTLCGSIAIVISTYVKLTKGGFGFNLSARKATYRDFIVTTVSLLLMTATICSCFYFNKTLSFVILTAIVSAIACLIFFYFSYKRDQIEFSFG